MTSWQLYTKGTLVWLSCPTNVWQKATIIEESNGKELLVKSESGKVQEIHVKDVKELPFLCNPDFLVGTNDLTGLSYLHEPAILNSLKQRFINDNIIYTRCGIILVAVNPYRDLGIYDDYTIQAYHHDENQDRNLDPHVYSVAKEAYTQLERDSQDQSIIVSGESGAGKTVSAKYTMRYFATAGGSSAETQIEKKVLISSPVMEAFGNAKTARNDNSSRFGKFIQIEFDPAYTIMGAHIKTYLLEKSRVVYQARTERNYHIFYQLCAAANLSEMSGLKLGPAELFHYTNQGEQAVIDGVNDLEEFNQTRNALSTLNLKSEEQNCIFKTLSGILHLGNIALLEAENEGCAISAKDKHLDVSLEQFEVSREHAPRFRRSLTSRQIISGKEIFTKPLQNNEAAFRRDALAKHIYARLFGWIVAKLNGSLASSTEIHRCIGILDIYGFETFDSNSFEQLCINFSNEKLQQQFSNHVFKLEQEEYAQEGLQWKFIDYEDNQPCIDLIEGKLGILDILDDECKFSAGSDESWLRNLEKNCSGNKYFGKSKRSCSTFTIQHFAGNVEYQVNGFIEKNRDTIDPEQVAILQLSSNPLLVSLFEEECVFTSAEPRKIAGTVPRKLGPLILKEIQPAAKSTLRRTKRTVGSQFKDSLTQLMQSLNSTCPHYIRCIKPNDSKVAFEFDPHRVVQQLRACGILETVRISAAGFPSRMSYDQFVNRYYQLAIGLRKGEPRKICETVLLNLSDGSDMCKFGQTKVFFRAGKIAQLEKLRKDLLWKSSVIIQKTWRGYSQRKLYSQLKRTTIFIQARVRGNFARAKALALRRNNAAIKIQCHVRGWLSRRKYSRIRSKIIGLQAHGRGFLVRQAVLKRKQTEKVIVIQKNVRMWLAVKKYRNTKKSIITVQSCVRRWFAKRELRRLKAEARSIECVKNLNKGLEIKVMQLQMDLDKRNMEVVTSLRMLEEETKKLKSQCIVADELSKTLKTKEATIEELEKKVASIESLKEEIKRLKENEVDLVNALSEAQKREKNLADTNDSLVEKIGKLEKTLSVEKQHWKDEEERLRDIIARQQREIEGSMPNNQDSFLIKEDYVLLLQERVSLKDKLQSALAHIEKLKKKFCLTRMPEIPEMLSPNLLHGSPIVKKGFESQGILKYNSLDAAKLTEGIVCQFTPSVARKCIQGTAAYLIFMALRYCDMASDEIGVKNISNSALNHIKRIVKENQLDQDLCVLWLANTARFLHCIRQYGCNPDSTYTRSNTENQSKMSLRNYDMSSYNKPLEDLLNFIYSKFWKTVKESLSGIIYPAIILYDSVSLSSTPFTPNRRGTGRYIDPKAAWDTLMDKLNQLKSLCNVFGVDPDITAQLYKQLFYFISSEVLNSLLLRKDMCNWATGVIIRYNITALEQWIRDNVPQGSDKAALILKTLQPVINASQLFQAKKTIEGVDNLVSSVDELTAPQILKLLHLFTPQGYEEVPSGFLPAVERKLKGIRPASEFDAQILADSNYLFPLNISYCPSTVDLETVQIPQGMSIPATLS
ncbi:unconventional myosin-Vb-like isoform X2 [Artemia franciscana]|uniref:unconventional myosin-Vb-like isoform X2 n=1 Tax=Artemia franciscana TaxID=6661 RepID=UPI0032D9F16F